MHTRIPTTSQTPESSMKPGESPDWCVGACPHSPLPPALTLSFCDSETAGGRLLLPLLLAAVLTGTRAHPVPRATRLPSDAKKCHLARFKSLALQELKAFRNASDAIVSLPQPSCVDSLQSSLSGLYPLC